MGLRFRKTIRLIPGLRLNLSKKGASFSVGGKGATVNIGKDGTRETLGLPGSGISYSEYQKRGKSAGNWLWTLGLAAASFVLYYLRDH